MADAGTVLPSSVLDTPKNDRGGNRSFTHLTRQEKDYKRLRVLITEIDGEGVTGTGIARESLRHKDRPILGETGWPETHNERLTQTEAETEQARPRAAEEGPG